MDSNEILSFQNLDVYKRSIELFALCSRLIESFPRGHGGLADHLRRASLSIPLNIAEGSGRTSTPEIQRYRAMARGSAMECAAILDACAITALVEENQLAQARSLILRIVQMLSRLCR